MAARRQGLAGQERSGVEIERIKQAGRRVPRRWRRHSPQQLPSSRLHSNPAEFYRVKVVGLVETLQRENDAAAREQTRGLVRRFI